MKNFYLCTKYSLDESKTQIFCYHGHNSPYDVLANSASIRRVALDELIDDYKQCNPQGISFKEKWGFSIAELQDKIIFGDTMRIEGDELIRKIDAIDKSQKNDVAALNQIFANLDSYNMIKSIDEIMTDAPNCILAKQRLEFEEEKEETTIEDESFNMSM